MINTDLPREFDPLLFQIHRQDAGALQFGQLRNELSHQTQAQHRDRFTQSDLRNSNAIEGDAAQGGETRVFEWDVFWLGHDQIHADQNRLTVSGAFYPIGHVITNLQVSNGVMFVHYNAGAGVAQHCIFAELGFNLIKGASRTLHFKNVPNFCELRRIVGDSAQHSFLMNASGFRSAADQRVERPDEDVARNDDWIGYFIDNDLLKALLDPPTGGTPPIAFAFATEDPSSGLPLTVLTYIRHESDNASSRTSANEAKRDTQGYEEAREGNTSKKLQPIW